MFVIIGWIVALSAVFGVFIAHGGNIAVVLKALPFLANTKDTALVPRPSNATGARYNEASIAFFQGVSQILQGKEPKDVLGQVEQRLQRVLR